MFKELRAGLLTLLAPTIKALAVLFETLTVLTTRFITADSVSTRFPHRNKHITLIFISPSPRFLFRTRFLTRTTARERREQGKSGKQHE